eukprot:9498913-Pyramimonas_sp.AAC.2
MHPLLTPLASPTAPLPIHDRPPAAHVCQADEAPHPWSHSLLVRAEEQERAALSQTGVKKGGGQQTSGHEVIQKLGSITGWVNYRGNQCRRSISNIPEYSLVPDPRYPLDS